MLAMLDKTGRGKNPRWRECRRIKDCVLLPVGEMKMQISGWWEYRPWKQDALEKFLKHSRLDLTYI